MATLILIRHGQSLGNLERRFTHGPDEPLTDEGREQARVAGRWVAANHAPTALYASPFFRAQETARLIGESIGLGVQTVEELREQFFGDLHGQPYDSFPPAAEGSGQARWERRPPGGETLLEVAHRAGPALDGIAHRHPGEPVVVVSHGGVMAALRGHVVGDLVSTPSVSGNATGYVLSHDGERYAEVDEVDIQG